MPFPTRIGSGTSGSVSKEMSKAAGRNRPARRDDSPVLAVRVLAAHQLQVEVGDCVDIAHHRIARTVQRQRAVRPHDPLGIKARDDVVVGVGHPRPDPAAAVEPAADQQDQHEGDRPESRTTSRAIPWKHEALPSLCKHRAGGRRDRPTPARLLAQLQGVAKFGALQCSIRTRCADRGRASGGGSV